MDQDNIEKLNTTNSPAYKKYYEANKEKLTKN